MCVCTLTIPNNEKKIIISIVTVNRIRIQILISFKCFVRRTKLNCPIRIYKKKKHNEFSYATLIILVLAQNTAVKTRREQRGIYSTCICDDRFVPAEPHDSLYLLGSHRFCPYHRRCHAAVCLDTELRGLYRWSTISMHQFSLAALRSAAGSPLRLDHCRRPQIAAAADSCNLVHGASDFEPVWPINALFWFLQENNPNRNLNQWSEKRKYLWIFFTFFLLTTLLYDLMILLHRNSIFWYSLFDYSLECNAKINTEWKLY